MNNVLICIDITKYMIAVQVTLLYLQIIVLGSSENWLLDNFLGLH